MRGYSRGRARAIAERDLYALAQAVVASVAWLVVVLLVLQGWLDDLGLLPRSDSRLEDHKTPTALLLLGLVFLPFPLGWLTAAVSQRVTARVDGWSTKTLRSGFSHGVRLETAREIKRSGIIAPPSAWDRSWATALAPR